MTPASLLDVSLFYPELEGPLHYGLPTATLSIIKSHLVSFMLMQSSLLVMMRLPGQLVASARTTRNVGVWTRFFQGLSIMNLSVAAGPMLIPIRLWFK
jgi:hypothetical protein